MIGRARRPRRVADGTVTPHRLAGGVAINVAATLILSAAGFLLTGFLVRTLGGEEFGAWVLIAAVLAYSSILDFGIGLTVMRFVAEAAHLPDRDEANRVVSTAIVAFTGVGAVVFVTGMAVAPLLADLFSVAPSQQGAFVTAFRISCAALALTFPSAVWTAVLQGLQDFGRLNAWILGQTAIVMTGQLVVVMMGYGIVALALVGAAGSVLLLLGKRYAARGHGIRTSPRHWDTATLRRIVSVSSWVFLLQVSGRLIVDTDAVLIGIMLGTAAVAAYQVALGPATVVRRTADQFNSVSLSAASSLKGQEAGDRIRLLLVEATRSVACVFLPCIALLAAWGEQLLVLWVGPEYASSYGTLVILTAGVLAIAVQGTAAQVLLALDRQRLMALVAGGEALCNVGLSIVLGLRFGIIGVAIGTAVPAAVMAFGITLPYTCRLVGTSYLRLMRRLLAPLAVSAGAFVVMAGVQRAFGDFPSLLVLAAAAAAAFGLTFAAALLSDPAARATYLPMVRGLLSATRSRPVEA